MNKQMFPVPVELMQNLLTYLGQKPYREVAGFLQEIQKLNDQVKTTEVQDAPQKEVTPASEAS